MGVRRKSREFALQMLFQADMGGQDAEQVRRSFWKERPKTEPELRSFADDLFAVAMDRRPEIDSLIERHAHRWRLERMAVVDRNVLRAAVAEFLGFAHTPRVVVINEALEITHRFSSPAAAQFVNAVLDGVARELEAGAAAPPSAPNDVPVG